MTGTAQIVEAQLVEHDEKDVFGALGHVVMVGERKPTMQGA